MDHKLYKTGDSDAPDAIKDRNGEVVLALCRVCGGVEGSLPSDCPGKKMSSLDMDMVYEGLKDFKDDEWISLVTGGE